MGMTNTFFLVWVGLLGLCLGSFANVVALRDNNRLSIWNGRSKCPHCDHTLAWYELIPLLSFLLQSGRCRECKTVISWRYPLVELLMAVLSIGVAIAVLPSGGIWALIGTLMAITIFLALSLIDLATMEVPVEYVVVVAILGGAGMVLGGMHTWQQTLLGLLGGAGLIAAILFSWKLAFKQDGMGEGDIWLAGAAGAIAGWPLIVVCLALAVFSGCLLYTSPSPRDH
jgi:leader peptidase (prepilin peptidase)/N-methyltransferase